MRRRPSARWPPCRLDTQRGRAFAGDWNAVFRNYLLDPDMEHPEIIAQIKQARHQ